MVDSQFAYCHHEKVRSRNYDEEFLRMVQPQSGSDGSELVGRTAVVEPSETSQTGLSQHPVVTIHGKEVLVKEAELGQRVKIQIQTEGEKAAIAEVIKPETQEPLTEEGKTEAVDSEDEVMEVLGIAESTPSVELDTDTDSTHSEDGDSNQERSPDNEDAETDRDAEEEIPSSTKSSSELDELRTKAEESAVENVPNSTTSTTRKTSEYTRSQSVVEYVKARARGECEGCGEPAPFTSKTGEPYLHAHHTHELGEGGSDTPETVIALCPNCHYRVHHGGDGDEYNRELREKLESIEPT